VLFDDVQIIVGIEKGLLCCRMRIGSKMSSN